MTDSKSSSPLVRGAGVLMLMVGVAVFAIRLHHAGPYAPPGGGNLIAGVLALAIGVFLAAGWTAGQRVGALARWAALAASPVVLFFALYAIFAELEETVSLRVADASGATTDLRLWIVDHDGAEWVTMPSTKSDAHGLDEARAELLRRGEWRCVTTTRYDDRAMVTEIHQLRHQKYAVQRMAMLIGMFSELPGENVVTLRLAPCAGA